MRYAGLIRDSIVDGVGIRDVIFFQGCAHHCKGCHNPQTWNYNGGEYKAEGEIVKELSDSDNNITISGGEPLDQFNSLLILLDVIKTQTNKTVWLYTGNVVDPSKRTYKKLAQYVDVIVDGKFDRKLKDPNLRFRGSSNQRVIDLKKSVKEQRIIEWEETE